MKLQIDLSAAEVDTAIREYMSKHHPEMIKKGLVVSVVNPPAMKVLIGEPVNTSHFGGKD
jgi:hypothetical protein